MDILNLNTCNHIIDDYPIGEVVQSICLPNDNYLAADGSSILTASYPALADALGIVHKFNRVTRFLPVDSEILYMCANSKAIVILLDYGSIYRSIDALNWESLHIRGYTRVYSLHVLNDTFYAFSSTAFYTSTDGYTWTSTSTSLTTPYTVQVLENNLWVATHSAIPNLLSISKDSGSTWLTQNLPSSFRADIVSYGASTIVVIDVFTHGNKVLYSITNGDTWQPSTLPNYLNWPHIYFDGSVFTIANGTVLHKGLPTSEWTTTEFGLSIRNILRAGGLCFIIPTSIATTYYYMSIISNNGYTVGYTEGGASVDMCAYVPWLKVYILATKYPGRNYTVLSIPSIPTITLPEIDYGYMRAK